MSKAGPKIKAIAPWFGGKRTLAGTIVQELGPHKSYWEPACGGLGVLLAKPVSSHETVNELHADLINLALVVASPKAPELYDRLQRSLHCEDLILEAKEHAREAFELSIRDPAAVDTEHVDRAYWYFILSWGGRNGMSGTKRINYQMAARWTSGGGSGAKRFSSATESLPWWHQRLRNVAILHRDLFEVLPRIHDQAGTVIYMDPPYFRRGGRSGASAYLHEFTADDHVGLAQQLHRFQKARVVVSYYDDPQLDELYPAWTKLLVYRQKNLHVQNRRGSTKSLAPEVLLINGPSLAQENPLLLEAAKEMPHG